MKFDETAQALLLNTKMVVESYRTTQDEHGRVLVPMSWLEKQMITSAYSSILLDQHNIPFPDELREARGDVS